MIRITFFNDAQEILNMKKQLKRILFLGALAVFSAASAFAQDDPKQRSITSDDFTSQRPAGKKKSVKYNYVRQDKNTVKRKSAKVKAKKPSNPTKKAERFFDVGVTMWKLRQPRSSDTGYKLPVRINDSLTQMWTAERVGPDTIFRAGDRVRFAVESSNSGFLYLINSEFYKDGGFGEPSVIFPHSSGEDNFVKPGLLVDIPDRTEDFPYFTIEPKKYNYAGELVTIIISPQPLRSLKTDENGKLQNLDELIELESGADVEIYSSENEHSFYTQAEAEAACGSKTRELVRQKLNSDKQTSNTNPCGEETRQLSREEPLPQTIYRVKARTGMPVVAFIKMRVEE